jgi:hypothetical protein
MQLQPNRKLGMTLNVTNRTIFFLFWLFSLPPQFVSLSFSFFPLSAPFLFLGKRRHQGEIVAYNEKLQAERLAAYEAQREEERQHLSTKMEEYKEVKKNKTHKSIQLGIDFFQFLTFFNDLFCVACLGHQTSLGKSAVSAA